MPSKEKKVLCSICNTENENTSNFCKWCGKKIKQLIQNKDLLITCPRCQKQVKRSTKFCSYCRFNISQFLQTEDEKETVLSCSEILTDNENREKEISSSEEKSETDLLISSLKDMYGLKFNELKILLSTQKYLYDKSDMAIAVIDEKTGQIISVNEGFLEFSELPEIELKQIDFISFLKKLNSRNSYCEIPSNMEKSEGYIYNKYSEKFLLRYRKSREPFDNNSLIVLIERPLKEEEDFLRLDGFVSKNLYLVSKIATEINSILHLDIILNNALKRVMDATKSDSGLIMFLNDAGELLPVASQGISHMLVNYLKKNPVRADKGSRGKALRMGKTIEARLRQDDSNSDMTETLVSKENLVSMVTVPLKHKEEVTGIIVLGKRKEEEYSTEEKSLLDAICDHIVIAIRNATLYEKLEENLKTLEEKNNRLKELEIKKEKLTYMIVHDLKNHIQEIMAFSEYLYNNSGIQNEKFQRMFQNIFLSSQDISKMTMNMLEIAKMEEGNIKINYSSADVREIMEELLNKMKIKIQSKNIEIIMSLPEEVPPLKADKNLLSRVLMNILDNGIKNSKSYNKIKIELIKDEKNFIFGIIDEGTGVPPEYREKIFEDFFSMNTEESLIGTSTGIGLSFCKMAVEAHGGRIWVEENSPCGSKFYFTLPVNQFIS